MILRNILTSICYFLVILLTGLLFSNCSSKGKQQAPLIYDTLYTNAEVSGFEIIIDFKKGISHNYPLMAIWTEDTSGNYLQTLYVAESIAKGVFNYGQTKSGKWMPGEIRRPASLPYWAHKRGVKEADGLYIPTPQTALPDAITGATPQTNFLLKSFIKPETPKQFYVLFEINQTWDWNEYWTNNKYPDDDEYKTSCQPALVYSAKIDLSKRPVNSIMKPIGHSHYSGNDGTLTTDLSTLTTALHIAEEIRVIVP
ncbi:MAG: hypothetical protein JXB49_28925 [Bacteroidales bacterium]|nr:hypothetical protein [Bacteroidales bacterium]